MMKEMVHSSSSPIIIDLDHFKLYLDTQGTRKLTLHFDTPSRRFYLSVIALVVEQMREKGIDATVPLRDHTEVLALLNETVGGGAGSSKEKQLLSRVYKKWKSILPDLENAPLFLVMGKSKDYGDASGKIYQFDESVKDAWANLFEYKGSQEKLRLRFSVEKLGVRLEDVVIAYGNQSDTHERRAWDRFVETIRENEDKWLESTGHDGSVNSPEFAEWTEDGGELKTTVSTQNPIEKEPITGDQAPDVPAISDPFIPIRDSEAITVSKKVFSTQKAQVKSWKRFGLMLISCLFLLMAAVALWKFYLHPTFQLDSMKSEAPVSPEASSEASIAVLPFANISGDPKDDYLCDGITEQIITSLSRTPKLFVIASNSTFTYKGKPVKIQQVRKDLGVRYVLEGSVQKLGDRVRITAQLIDAVTGNHLWANKYDRQLKDIFSLQDDISRNVVMALQINLTEGEYARIYGSGTDNLDAYLKAMRGMHHVLRFNKNDNEIARKYYKEAIALDPEYPNAYVLLAWTYRHEAKWGWTKNPAKSQKKAIELAKHAISLDDANAMPYMVFALVYVETEQFEKALSAGEKGFSLEPDNADVNYLYGYTLLNSGLFQEAVEKLEKAIQLSPINPYFNKTLSSAYFALGEYESAIGAAKKQIKIGRFVLGSYIKIAASYSLLGNKEEAQKAIEQILKINPKFSLESHAKYWLNKPLHPKDRKVKEIMFDAVRKAGLK